MLIEFGEFTDFGEAWIRYEGGHQHPEHAHLMQRARASGLASFGPDASPRLIDFYELDEGDYTIGGCLVFAVDPEVDTSP